MKQSSSRETRRVVTAFLTCQGKILLVRRSQRVGSYQGLWSGISGYLEAQTALAQALQEVREETVLKEKRSSPCLKAEFL